jgi:pimeloyl-ACP methyl ester carboxylesterase
MIGLVHDEEGIKDHKKMYPQAKKLVSEGKGKQILDHKLWGLEILSAESYLHFFENDAKDAIFNYWSDSRWDVVNSISHPVLAITGTKDDGIEPVMDPHKAMEKLKSELKKAPRVETIVYDGAEHSFEGFEDEIVRDVVRFVSAD